MPLLDISFLYSRLKPDHEDKTILLWFYPEKEPATADNSQRHVSRSYFFNFQLGVPEPAKYVEDFRFWLFLLVLGYDSTYFWGPGRV